MPQFHPTTSLRRFRPHEIRINFRPRRVLADLWALIPPRERVVVAAVGLAWLAVFSGVVAAFVRAVQ